MDQRVVSYRSRSMQQPYVPDHNYQGLHPRDPAYPPADPGYPFRPDMPYPGADQPIYSNLDLPLSQTLDALKVIGETLHKLYYEDKLVKNQREFLAWTKNNLGFSKSTTYEYIISYRVYRDIAAHLPLGILPPVYQSHCQLMAKVPPELLVDTWIQVYSAANSVITTGFLENFLVERNLMVRKSYKKRAPRPDGTVWQRRRGVDETEEDSFQLKPKKFKNSLRQQSPYPHDGSNLYPQEMMNPNPYAHDVYGVPHPYHPEHPHPYHHEGAHQYAGPGHHSNSVEGSDPYGQENIPYNGEGGRLYPKEGPRPYPHGVPHYPEPTSYSRPEPELLKDQEQNDSFLFNSNSTVNEFLQNPTEVKPELEVKSEDIVLPTAPQTKFTDDVLAAAKTLERMDGSPDHSNDKDFDDSQTITPPSFELEKGPYPFPTPYDYSQPPYQNQPPLDPSYDARYGACYPQQYEHPYEYNNGFEFVDYNYSEGAAGEKVEVRDEELGAELEL